MGAHCDSSLDRFVAVLLWGLPVRFLMSCWKRKVRRDVGIELNEREVRETHLLSSTEQICTDTSKTLVRQSVVLCQVEDSLDRNEREKRVDSPSHTQASTPLPST